MGHGGRFVGPDRLIRTVLILSGSRRPSSNLDGSATATSASMTIRARSDRGGHHCGLMVSRSATGVGLTAEHSRVGPRHDWYGPPLEPETPEACGRRRSANHTAARSATPWHAYALSWDDEVRMASPSTYP